MSTDNLPATTNSQPVTYGAETGTLRFPAGPDAVALAQAS